MWPGQAVLSITGVYWTSEVHFGIKRRTKGLAKCKKRCMIQIEHLVELVRGELSFVQRITLGISQNYWLIIIIFYYVTFCFN